MVEAPFAFFQRKSTEFMAENNGEMRFGKPCQKHSQPVIKPKYVFNTLLIIITFGSISHLFGTQIFFQALSRTIYNLISGWCLKMQLSQLSSNPNNKKAFFSTRIWLQNLNLFAPRIC
jgi:hypothetical protein